MSARDPRTRLRTHEVDNQPPPFEPIDLYDTDPVLQGALQREGAGWAEERARAFGALMGSEEVGRLAVDANRFPPELVSFDRHGRRLDEVRYHPAYHELMRLAVEHEVHAIAWTADAPGGHVAHTALEYLLAQAEQGVCCPVTMTYAALPALRRQPDVAAAWEAKLLSTAYDARSIPATEKAGVTVGMAMTEKQGGSDVRANTTRARAVDAAGPGEAYDLQGHKWFCSAPMSDAFLTLAQADGGLSCFLVPRWRPDGHRNPLKIQRLKDKLGNRSNASAEIEYDGTLAVLIGEEGRGVRTILEMVHHTRLDTSMAPAALMRQALARAAHHASHRRAFGKALVDHPLMKSVLADLALESEAAVALLFRVARAFDDAPRDPEARLLARVAVAVAKYWLNKRAPNVVYEALEVHGGNGYVEESVMPRLYREAPLNSIWEGSGNVICLDVMRSLTRQPGAADAFLAEAEKARGGDGRLDRSLDALQGAIHRPDGGELSARRLTETMALVLQASLLVRHAPPAVADAFCGARLGAERAHTYGTLPPGTDLDGLLTRAVPQQAG